MRPSSLGGGRIMRRTLSVRPVIVTERHVAPPSELQWHTCTFRHALRAAYRTAISAAQILVYLALCFSHLFLCIVIHTFCVICPNYLLIYWQQGVYAEISIMQNWRKLATCTIDWNTQVPNRFSSRLPSTFWWKPSTTWHSEVLCWLHCCICLLGRRRSSGWWVHVRPFVFLIRNQTGKWKGTKWSQVHCMHWKTNTTNSCRVSTTTYTKQWTHLTVLNSR